MEFLPCLLLGIARYGIDAAVATSCSDDDDVVKEEEVDVLFISGFGGLH